MTAESLEFPYEMRLIRIVARQRDLHIVPIVLPMLHIPQRFMEPDDAGVCFRSYADERIEYPFELLFAETGIRSQRCDRGPRLGEYPFYGRIDSSEIRLHATVSTVPADRCRELRQ